MTRISCLGDSITDCGRLFSADPLGKGYVKQLSCLLHNTDHRFSIENRGIDGFTLERLLQNTDFWLESSDPDIVTVLIGPLIVVSGGIVHVRLRHGTGMQIA